MMLCNICIDIDTIGFQYADNLDDATDYLQDEASIAFEPYRQDRHDYIYYVHQPNFPQLAVSKAAGCYFCAALWYAFSEPPTKWKQQPIDSETALSKNLPVVLRILQSSNEDYHLRSWRDLPVQDYIYAFCGATKVEMRRAEIPSGGFERFSDDLEKLHEQGTLLEVDGSTGSDINIELAQAWYQRCSHGDLPCKIQGHQSNPVPVLPTRVIDVRRKGEDPMLYEPKAGERDEYVALSHCWGKTKPMPVVRDAASSGSASLLPRNRYVLPPLSRWPLSFQHAVDIVRRFHLRYLWIDNTGIVQGDVDDWARESGKMAQYFGDATFTIAASWASNDDEGIFHDRNPLLSRPLRLCHASSDGHTQTHDALYVSVTGDSACYQQRDSLPPLVGRAWVLQEEMLARRLLKFGDSNITWKCFSISDASESKPIGTAVRSYKYNQTRDLEPMRIQLRLTDHDMTGSARRNPYYDSWYDIVERFTMRNMKYKNDVLPALSGLAQTFADRLGNDSYFAGLWNRDMKFGLLWQANKIASNRPVLPADVPNFLTEGFVGPSWSWISQCQTSISYRFSYKVTPGGPHSYTDEQSGVDTDILDVTVHPRSPAEPFGQVCWCGSLRVRAKLPTIHIDTEDHKLTDEDEKRRKNVSGGWPTHVRQMTLVNSMFDLKQYYRGHTIYGDCDVDDPNAPLYLAHAKNGTVSATFLPLFYYWTDYDTCNGLLGLALLPTGKAENEYIRIGRAGIDMEDLDMLRDSNLVPREITIV